MLQTQTVCFLYLFVELMITMNEYFCCCLNQAQTEAACSHRKEHLTHVSAGDFELSGSTDAVRDRHHRTDRPTTAKTFTQTDRQTDTRDMFKMAETYTDTNTRSNKTDLIQRWLLDRNER